MNHAMIDRPRLRRPTSPGEILREEFLVPLGLSQRRLAEHLGCRVNLVNRIVNGRCAVTAEMALKLGAACVRLQARRDDPLRRGEQSLR